MGDPSDENKGGAAWFLIPFRLLWQGKAIRQQNVYKL
jgi:hypothetical protein